jgi:predicted metal-dependent peptidase
MPVAEVQDGAWEAIRHARVGLMMSHPYLAAAVARLPLVDVTGHDWCPTCATDGYAIYVNTVFTATLSHEDLMFVMAHELVHCIVGHMDRRGDRDRGLWNFAADYATNALLEAHGFRPVQGTLLEPRFRERSAEQIYDELLKEAEGAKPSGRRRPPRAGRAGAFDRHLDPNAPEVEAVRPEGFPTESERRALRRELISAAASAAGNSADRWKSALGPATVNPLAWKALLAQFLSGLRRSDYRLFPTHRKHVHRGMYLPSLGVPGPQHIVVAVDTSGSMSDRELSEVFAQIDHLRAATECAVTLLQFDTVIQAHRTIDPWETVSTALLSGNEAIGRGGTDLCAPFDCIAADEEGQYAHLDALIVITDGFGASPATAPEYSLLWVITANGRNSCRFGVEVQLPGS